MDLALAMVARVQRQDTRRGFLITPLGHPLTEFPTIKTKQTIGLSSQQFGLLSKHWRTVENLIATWLSIRTPSIPLTA
jgi:ABC-type methionine transport system ATPase subunit